MKYSDVEWDSAGRLIIKNKDLLKEIKDYVGPDRMNTKPFRVVEEPTVPDPMDLLCRIITTI